MGLIYEFGSVCLGLMRMGINLTKYYLMKLIMIMLARTHLGSSHFEEDESRETEQRPSSIVLIDGASPSLVSVPVDVVIAFIKKRLQVVEFGHHLDVHGDVAHHDDHGYEEADAACSICLDCIQRSHEIRQLTNCDHVFHRHCLDCWVDEGRITCPLCRSLLLPRPLHPNRTIFQEIMVQCTSSTPGD